jgi:glycerol uptake facilitator-like aquaporin
MPLIPQERGRVSCMQSYLKGSSDWSYAWIPVLGPIVGAAIAAGLHMANNDIKK